MTHWPTASGLKPGATAGFSSTPSGPNGSSFTSATLASSDPRRVEQLKSELNAKESPQGTLVSLPSDALFGSDKYRIQADARPRLEKVAELIKHLHPAVVEINGHTDSKGTDKHNRVLSARRAAAVKSYLVKNFGIAAGQLTAKGLGRAKPVAPNTKPDGSDNPEGRQLNGRIEFIIKR